MAIFESQHLLLLNNYCLTSSIVWLSLPIIPTTVKIQIIKQVKRLKINIDIIYQHDKKPK